MAAHYLLVDSQREPVAQIAEQLHAQVVEKRRTCGFVSYQIDRNVMVQYLLALEAQLDIQVVQQSEGAMHPDDSQALHHAASVLFESPLFLAIPDEPTIQGLLHDVQDMHAQEEVDLVFIDTAGIDGFNGSSQEGKLESLKQQLHAIGFAEGLQC